MLRKGLVSGLVGVVVSLCASGAALAQTGSISGSVMSVEGARPVAGAQVQVVGAGAGALTRDDGRYSIALSPGTYTVRVTRIGFAPDSQAGIVVASGATVTVDFRLRESARVLTGMVVIGYGETQARDRTGSVDVVSAEEFNTGVIVSPEQLIQSKVAGVQVVDNNEPGGGMSVRIRGTSSITGSSEPLFVVDGVPIQVGGGLSAGRNPLNFINPGDIESITVLKDASSAAIYGSRGTNGVVIIKTKSGAQGRQVSFGSTVSQSTVTGGPNLLNAAQFRAAVTEFAPENISKLGSASTNWRDAIERSAPGREQTMSVAGARDEMNYRLSLGYLNQSGVVEGTDLRKLSTSLNYRDQLFDRFDISGNLKGARTDDNFTPGSVIGNATAFAPTQPIRTGPGSFFEWNDNLAPGNPIATLGLVSDRGTTYRSVGNVEGKYHTPFLDGLTGTVNVGYDFATARRTVFTPSTERSQITSGNGGNFFRRNPSQLNTVLDAYGNYVREFDRYQSNVDLTAGYSYEQSKGDYPEVAVNGLASNLLGPNGIPASTKPTVPTLFVEESRLISFFGRANYSLRDKYLATLSVRRDGSSRFGPGKQWGIFPAAAFAWRMSDEPFIKGITPISDLKLRLSWGVNGNQSFANYMAISSYTIGNSLAQAQFGNQFVPTIRPSAADPNLKWEETTSSNIGFDFGLLRNRVAGTIDYYRKKTKDLLFLVPIAQGTNLSDFVMKNIGSMENRGLELGLNAQLLSGGFHGLTWNASFNAAKNSNKLLQINSVGGGTERIPVGEIAGGVGNTIQVLQPGNPVNSFFVYKHKIVNGKPVSDGNGSVPDTALYQDLNGDGAITQSDRRVFKDPAPKWILGHTSQMGYGNFDASFVLRAYLGNYVYNNVASNLGNFSRIRGSGTPVNLDASVLRNRFMNPQYFSDVYIEDGSFLRMDNITVGYTFRNLRSVQQLRVFGTVQNAFTVTGYNGVDPTAGLLGIDNNLYPRSRTLLTGATIQF